jgi:hypothetical protein
MTLLRQGDILVVAIDGFPHAAAPAPPVRYNGRLCRILALGEATGHAHTLIADGRVDYYPTPEADPCLTTGYPAICDHGAVLEHEEHRELPLPAGLYRIVQQREHDPLHRRWAHAYD